MLRHLLFRNKPEPERKAAFALVILVVMLTAGLLVSLTDFKLKGPAVPLLTPADGLVQAKEHKEAERFAGRTIPLPEERFGAEPIVYGVYTRAQEGLPEGSVAVVLVRDDQRFVELFQKPGMDLGAEVRRFAANRVQTLMLDGRTEAKLLDLSRAYMRCVPPEPEEDRPGVCFITRLLIFEQDGVLYTIGADGDNATEGELIAMAKSMLNEKPAE